MARNILDRAGKILDRRAVCSVFGAVVLLFLVEEVERKCATSEIGHDHQSLRERRAATPMDTRSRGSCTSARP